MYMYVVRFYFVQMTMMLLPVQIAAGFLIIIGAIFYSSHAPLETAISTNPQQPVFRMHTPLTMHANAHSSEAMIEFSVSRTSSIVPSTKSEEWNVTLNASQGVLNMIRREYNIFQHSERTYEIAMWYSYTLQLNDTAPTVIIPNVSLYNITLELRVGDQDLGRYEYPMFAIFQNRQVRCHGLFERPLLEHNIISPCITMYTYPVLYTSEPGLAVDNACLCIPGWRKLP